MKRRNIIPVLTGLGLYVVLSNALLLLYVVIGPPLFLFFGIPTGNVSAFWIGFLIEIVMPMVMFLPGAVYIGREVTDRGWLYGLLGALVIDATGIASSIKILATIWLFRAPPGEGSIFSSDSIWNSPAGLVALLLLLPIEGILGGWWGERIRKKRRSV